VENLFDFYFFSRSVSFNDVHGFSTSKGKKTTRAAFR